MIEIVFSAHFAPLSRFLGKKWTANFVIESPEFRGIFNRLQVYTGNIKELKIDKNHVKSFRFFGKNITLLRKLQLDANNFKNLQS